MLNGAFAIGAIDCVTHIAEEIPQYIPNSPGTDQLLIINRTEQERTFPKP